jgi:osmotically-inducible protein OsmY
MRVDKRPDPEISSNAIETLRNELPYSSEHLKVAVKDGWLTLEGYVEWPYQRDRAQKAVQALRGVLGVLDKLEPKLRVAASDVERKLEQELKRSVELDANRSSAETGSRNVMCDRVKSWVILDGFSVHGAPVGR